MDLSNYSRKELLDLRDQVGRELQTRQEQNKHRARQEIKDIAKKYGVAIADIYVGPGGRPSRMHGGVMYRHPDDPNKTWTGRGRRPNWIKEWEAHGGNMEELRVR